LLKGRLEEVRDALQEVLDQVGDQAQGAGGGTSPALPEGPSSSSSAAGESSGATPEED
jgi:hypothetical protein